MWHWTTSWQVSAKVSHFVYELWERQLNWNFRFANKKSFIFVFGVVGLIFSSSHAYYNGTITTMEKRFKIASKNMGFISSGNDITGFLLSMFIAYYGGRGMNCITNHVKHLTFVIMLKVIAHVGWLLVFWLSLFIA